MHLSSVDPVPPRANLYLPQLGDAYAFGREPEFGDFKSYSLSKAGKACDSLCFGTVFRESSLPPTVFRLILGINL